MAVLPGIARTFSALESLGAGAAVKGGPLSVENHSHRSLEHRARNSYLKHNAHTGRCQDLTALATVLRLRSGPSPGTR